MVHSHNGSGFPWLRMNRTWDVWGGRPWLLSSLMVHGSGASYAATLRKFPLSEWWHHAFGWDPGLIPDPSDVWNSSRDVIEFHCALDEYYILGEDLLTDIVGSYSHYKLLNSLTNNWIQLEQSWILGEWSRSIVMIAKQPISKPPGGSCFLFLVATSHCETWIHHHWFHQNSIQTENIIYH